SCQRGPFAMILLTIARAAIISAAFAALAPTLTYANEPALERQKVELVAPPLVHPHEQATEQKPKIVEFRMEAQEKEIVIDDEGKRLGARTFSGAVRGPMLVVQGGDSVEPPLDTPAASAMPHNVDFHAATGGLGGGALTSVGPGEQVVLRWKATRPGVFVYH